MRLARLPACALQFRDQMLLPRPADAEIADERPGARNVERLGDSPRIEDRDPANAKAAGAGREPERMQRAHCRIAADLRHRARAEAVALLRRLVAEHRDLDRRVAQACELELGVKLGPFAAIGAERLAIGGLEIGPDRGPARL